MAGGEDTEMSAGPTCLVTGASSGIGAAIARELHRRGLDTTLVARRGDVAARVAAELSASGASSRALTADLSSSTDRQRLLDELAETKRHVDVLVNCAGSGSSGTVAASDRA
jgi:short-subunit dehydrogenase